MLDTVSASDIVRQFGHWQDRALAAPVYIRHHGRAKLVLASIDFVEQMVAGRGAADAGRQSIEELLDLIDPMVIVTDASLCVIGMSQAARHHFARQDWHGRTLANLLPDHLRAIMMRSVRHVCETGLTDDFQLRVGTNAERRLDVTIRSFGDGVCIVGHDRSAGDAGRNAAALSDAVRQTLRTLGNVAVVRINLRGFVIGASESFEMLTGLAPEVYRSVRLPTLFDVATRIAVSDALERTIDQAQPQVVAARLMVNRGEPVDVRIAFSSEMLRASIDTVVATVVAVG